MFRSEAELDVAPHPEAPPPEVVGVPVVTTDMTAPCALVTVVVTVPLALATVIVVFPPDPLDPADPPPPAPDADWTFDDGAGLTGRLAPRLEIGLIAVMTHASLSRGDYRAKNANAR
jgi:hypothetical protein